MNRSEFEKLEPGDLLQEKATKKTFVVETRYPTLVVLKRVILEEQSEEFDLLRKKREQPRERPRIGGPVND